MSARTSNALRSKRLTTSGSSDLLSETPRCDESSFLHAVHFANLTPRTQVQSCKYIFGLSSPKAVVATARLLENVGKVFSLVPFHLDVLLTRSTRHLGVAAYSGAAPDIQDKGTIESLVRISRMRALSLIFFLLTLFSCEQATSRQLPRS